MSLRLALSAILYKITVQATREIPRIFIVGATFKTKKEEKSLHKYVSVIKSSD